MGHKVLSDLKKLRAEFVDGDPQAKETIAAWEQTAKRALITKSLEKHEGMVLILQELRDRIDRMNYLLSEDEEITDIDRRLVQREKRVYKWLLGLFETAEQTIDGVAKEVEEQLS